MARIRLTLLIGLFYLGASTVQAAEKRVALVIGVGAYRNAPNLPNPPRDARLIAPLLTRLGFETDLVTDPDRAALEAAVRRFSQRMEGASATVFFYAGHGLQVGGRNYLLPVDAKVERETDLRWEALDAQTVLDALEGAGRVNLVFLDACRDNPLSRSLASKMGARSTAIGRGLAREDRAGAGTLIAYATDPGDVAADGEGVNSPFTTALGKYIVMPGLEIRQIMTRVRADVLASTGGRQRPWDNSSLAEDFYFTPPAARQAADPVPSPSPYQAGGDAAELAFWNAVQASPDPRDVEAYLETYPRGRFVVLARNKLDRLRREVSLLAGTREPGPPPSPLSTGGTPVPPSSGPVPLVTPTPVPLVTPSPSPIPPVPVAQRQNPVVTPPAPTPISPPPVPTRQQNGVSAQVAGLFDTPPTPRQPSAGQTPPRTGSNPPAPNPSPVPTSGPSSGPSPSGVTAAPASPGSRAAQAGKPAPRAARALLAEGFVLTPRFINGSGITSGVFQPDGHQVLTGGGDGTARLWEPVTGQQLRVYGADGDPVIRSVASSQDGKFVVLGLSNGNARLLDAGTGREARIFKGHEGWITAAAFSPDGKLLLTAAGDRTTRLWEVTTGTQLRMLEGHRGIVTAAVFSPDGKSVLTGSDDKTARLWDTATGQSTRVLEGHTARVRSVAFSPDGTLILTGSDDKTARLWEVGSAQAAHVLEGHTDRVRGVAFSPDGRWMLTGSDDKTARLWETRGGRFLRVFSGHRDGIGAVAFSGTGMVALTVSDDATARLWDVTTGGVRQTLLPLVHRGALALNAEGLPLALTGVENEAYYFSRGPETRMPAALRAEGYDLPVPARAP